jgi:hypothetical protein
MSSRSSSLRAAVRRHRVVLAAGAAVLLAGGGTTAAFAASSTPATPTAAVTASPCTPGIGALLRAAPRSLRTDLQHLRKDSADHRAADRAAIRAKALAGGYGAELGRLSRIVAGKDGASAAALPAALKADLKNLRDDPKGSDTRKQQVATIWSKALAGSYGANIESLAKDAKSRADTRCAARTAKAGAGS